MRGPLAPMVGLCAVCRHHRVIENRRGSRFHLCERSKTDARFPRYPPLPVLRCPGFEAGDEERESREGTRAGDEAPGEGSGSGSTHG